MLRSNEDIRRAIGAAGLRQYQVAEALGMLDGNFSRKLRSELPREEKEKIFRAIEGLEKEKTDERR
ncbi:MAG: hypothetical protein J6L87_02720 [Clostridia bacterium]|nr:hypothetical protein [Clostridia bacterium]